MGAMGGVQRGARRVDRRPLSPVGRWLLLLVALGGLLAMHGLSDHGVGGPAAVGPATTHVAMDTGTPATDPADDAVARGGAADGPGEHHGGSVVGMCLAVIGAVLLLGVVARRSGFITRLRHALTTHLAVLTATSFWARARGPAPPDLRLLSIQRC